MGKNQSQRGAKRVPRVPRAKPAVARKRGADLRLSLAWSIVGSSATPLVLLDGKLGVVLASASFCKAFEIDQAAAEGQPFCRLGEGEWDADGLQALLEGVASGNVDIPAFEWDLVRAGKPPRRLILNAHRLDNAELGQVRLLVGVADTTDARTADRLKDDQLREKAVLLQEVRHRVANSLQIIASTLMQAARQAQSEEARSHLRNAHSRLMSVASLERQLSASTLGQVAAKSYLAELCENLRASMIENPEQIELDLQADDTALEPQVSVSLGLIVTELVINSLKHAFPEGRKGKVTVSYRAEGPGWELTISDNGVGRPAKAVAASETRGLGTMIVAALAKQLSAKVEITDAKPGSRICVRCAKAARRAAD